ncbi:MAG: hypothetical protein KHZ90_08625 [Veillonella parvula]|uniref:Uncharacterized protein n=1 Tax=Veillonella parvula TaxID=29466 RepID=A0A942WNG0_VEIPA|nr:hypothetical protein [Veillonella parvula]MBS4893826.1 hypothetical protein [Veillonella parvula]
MFTVERAKQILSLIEGTKPELKFCNTNIIESNKFAAEISLLDNTITIVQKIKDHSFNELMKEYIKDELKFDNSSYVFNGFLECFAFLHEIGHIIDYLNNDNSLDDREVQFTNYKDTKYTTIRERFNAYRSITLIEVLHLKNSLTYSLVICLRNSNMKFGL